MSQVFTYKETGIEGRLARSCAHVLGQLGLPGALLIEASDCEAALITFQNSKKVVFVSKRLMERLRAEGKIEISSVIYKCAER
jgi:hypothetical protein